MVFAIVVGCLSRFSFLLKYLWFGSFFACFLSAWSMVQFGCVGMSFRSMSERFS